MNLKQKIRFMELEIMGVDKEKLEKVTQEMKLNNQSSRSTFDKFINTTNLTIVALITYIPVGVMTIINDSSVGTIPYKAVILLVISSISLLCLMFKNYLKGYILFLIFVVINLVSSFI